MFDNGSGLYLNDTEENLSKIEIVKKYRSQKYHQQKKNFYFSFVDMQFKEMEKSDDR